jgi:hypothetical protein
MAMKKVDWSNAKVYPPGGDLPCPKIDVCTCCNKNPAVREGIVICKECIEKQDYSDISISPASID